MPKKRLPARYGTINSNVGKKVEGEKIDANYNERTKRSRTTSTAKNKIIKDSIPKKKVPKIPQRLLKEPPPQSGVDGDDDAKPTASSNISEKEVTTTTDGPLSTKVENPPSDQPATASATTNLGSTAAPASDAADHTMASATDIAVHTVATSNQDSSPAQPLISPGSVFLKYPSMGAMLLGGPYEFVNKGSSNMQTLTEAAFKLHSEKLESALKDEGTSPIPAVGQTADPSLANSNPLKPVTSGENISEANDGKRRSNRIASQQSMSLAGVASPSHAIETVDDTVARLKLSFAGHGSWLEIISNEVLPHLNSLPPAAMDFILSIFGTDEGIKPARHAETYLNNFMPLCSSLRFAALAEHKITGTDIYQFRLRYFAGLGDDHDDENVSQRTDPDAKVAQFITKFFTGIFNNPEHDPVEKCVNRARSLYITVQSMPRKKQDPTNNNDGDEFMHFTDHETIVCCINFAIMKPRGFYVNWLATSNEVISPRKYGDDLMLLLSDQTWQRRHFDIFLVQVTNFSVLLHLRLTGELSADYNIVLQARSTEPAARFYTDFGFDEGGPASSTKGLETEIFQGFGKALSLSINSKTDFIHVIWNQDEIVWFTNKGGMFKKGKPIAKEFPTMVSTDDQETFIFPFAAVREHLMLLATTLDFFFLPFQDGTPMHDFIQPNMFVSNEQRTFVCEDDRDSVARKGSRTHGYLTDNAIDFFIRW